MKELSKSPFDHECKGRIIIKEYEFLGQKYYKRYYKCAKCNKYLRFKKICKYCLEEKPLKMFKPHGHTLDGLWIYCNKCKDKAIKSRRPRPSLEYLVKKILK
jgi:hypothetical protein